MGEREYWESRYSTGGNSGLCSVGTLRNWRWKIIKKHVSLKNKSVLDVGCGDLRFWEGKQHKDYTGVDISSFIIEKNSELYPIATFICADAATLHLDRKFDIVLCFEMLFHIMSEESLVAILQNLDRWTENTLFISCWRERPRPLLYTHYQAYYPLEEYIHYLPNLKLKKYYNTDTGLRALYVFTKED